MLHETHFCVKCIIAVEVVCCVSDGSKIIGQEFEGHETVEFGVFRFIDDAHAPATEFFDDAVVRNGLAEHIDGKSYGVLGRGKEQVNLRRWS